MTEAGRAAPTPREEQETCEFCEQPDDIMPVCCSCWTRANEGSGWMQRAHAAEGKLAESDARASSLTQEQARLHELISELNAIHDPELDPELQARVDAVLSGCANPVCNEALQQEQAQAAEVSRLREERDTLKAALKAYEDQMNDQQIADAQAMLATLSGDQT